MGKKDNLYELIVNESYKQQLDIWFRAYNISHEKLELFHDFLFTLYEFIDNTYLGVDVMDLDVDQKNHFIWCWNKTIKQFELENIKIKSDGKHFDYLWFFFQEAYYYNNLKNIVTKIKEYFDVLFDFNHKKTKAELDILVEIYKLMNEALKN
jgi:hypothetical protein